MEVQQSLYLAASIPRGSACWKARLQAPSGSRNLGASQHSHPEPTPFLVREGVSTIPFFQLPASSIPGGGGGPWQAGPWPFSESVQRLVMACPMSLEEKERGGGGDACNWPRPWRVKTIFFKPPKDGLRICKFISMKIIAKIKKSNHTQQYF